MDLSDIKTKIYSQNVLLNGCDDDNGCGCKNSNYQCCCGYVAGPIGETGPMGAQYPFRHIL